MTSQHLGIGMAMALAALSSFSAQGQAPSAPEGAAKWIAVLKSDAPIQERFQACRELAVVGGRNEVPALAALLPDEALSHMARMALEPIPDASVDEAFRAALDTLRGRPLVGVVGSIGRRGDAQAVPRLAQFLANADAEVAAAAAASLGRIGTPEAAKALESVPAGAPAPVVTAILDGRLACAAASLAKGRAGDAIAAWDRLCADSSVPEPVRMAALRNSLLARGEGGLPSLVESLAAPEAWGQGAALSAARGWPDAAAARALAAAMDKLPPDRQREVIELCGDRADAALAPLLVPWTQTGEVATRVAAIRALGEIADPASLSGWTVRVLDPEAAVAEAARGALAAFPGPEADAAVLDFLSRGDPPRRVIGAELAGLRRMTGAAAALALAAVHPVEPVRLAAIRSLGTLGGESELPALISRLDGDPSRAERQAVEAALAAICSRSDAVTKWTAAVKAHSGESAAALLRVAKVMPVAPVLEAVRAAAWTEDPVARAAARRVLCDWPGPEAMPDLDRLSKDAADEPVKILATRGMIRLIPLQSDPPDARASALKDLLGRATLPEDRTAALAALGAVPSAVAMTAAVERLGDPALKAEAAAAAVAVAEKIVGAVPDAVHAAMQAVVQSGAADPIAKRAKALIQKTKPAPAPAAGAK